MALSDIGGVLDDANDTGAASAATTATTAAQNIALDQTVDSTRDSHAATGDSQLPGRIGEFAILDELGAGGMGRVYVAHDTDLDRRVAIKVLHPCADPTAQQARNTRFLREAQGLARVSHPNVVAVHEIGIDDGSPFIVMELVEGDTLRDWQRGDHDWQQVVRVYAQAGRGLAACHAAQLVHRDVKPENILLGQSGRPRISDLGLVGAMRSDDGHRPQNLDVHGPLNATLTNDGAALGTLAYMPPEQLCGEQVDARADQFAFAVALYEGLHGERPFAGRSGGELLQAITENQRRPIRTDIPRPLRAALERALSPNRGERFAELDELLDVLDASLENTKRRGWPGRGSAFAVAAIAVAGLSVFMMFGRSTHSLSTAALVPVSRPALPSTPAAEARKRRAAVLSRAHALENEAFEYATKDNNKQAAKSQRAALKLLDDSKLEAPLRRASLLTNLAVYENDIEQVKQAIAHLNEALALIEPSGDIEAETNTREILGSIHFEQDRSVEAEKQFRLVLTKYKTLQKQEPTDVARMQDNLAAALIDLKRYTEAKKLLQSTLELRTKAKLTSELVDSYSRFARLYRAMNNKKLEKKYAAMASKAARKNPQ